MALDPIPQQSGFSGYIQPGLGFLDIKSNTVAKILNFDLSDQKISSLGSPDSQSTALIMLPYKIGYTFGTSRTEIFLGTDLGDLLSFDTSQQLGVKHEFGAIGLFQAGLLFSGTVRVWKDPYVTGQNRNDTSRQIFGGQFVWDKILGSNLELTYAIRSINIGSEKSGQFLGLSDSDQDRLDRNGTVHQVSAGYGFKFGDKHTLTPQVTLFYEDLDGGAMANTGADLQLTYLYNGDPVSLVLNGYVGQADCDKKNPVFDKTRNDDCYGAGATVYYKNPWGLTLFGSEPMRFFVTGGYYAVDANIPFYNQEALLGMGGAAFRWK